MYKKIIEDSADMYELEESTKRIPDNEKTPDIDSAKNTSSSSPGQGRAVANQAKTLEWHSMRWSPSSSCRLLPGAPCPAFSTLSVLEDEKTTIFSLESFKTPYVVVVHFLPLVERNWRPSLRRWAYY